MSTALPIVLALLVGAAIGAGFGLYVAAVLREGGRHSLELFAERQAEIIGGYREAIASLLEQNRELAHKVSAPDQAAIDHVFDKAQAQRMQQREQEKREQAAREIDRELAARGITLE